jgi:hypothetical protein
MLPFGGGEAAFSRFPEPKAIAHAPQSAFANLKVSDEVLERLTAA